MKAIDYEIINDYISGNLRGETLLAFEKEMQTNSELANEVALYKSIEDNFTKQIKNKAEADKLKETLSNLNKTHFAKQPAKIISFKTIAFAVSAVAAALILFFALRNTQSENADDLYANEIKNIAPIGENLRGIGIDEEIQQAKALYNAKNYAKALPKLKLIVEKNAAETELTMAIGVCYLQTNNVDSALQIFRQLAVGKTVFSTNALMYKALIFYKQNNMDSCKAALLLIPTDAEKYKTAQSLLKKLK